MSKQGGQAPTQPSAADEQEDYRLPPELAGRLYLPCNRVLRMSDEERAYINSSPAAYEAFKQEEWDRVSDPETGWAYFIDNYGSMTLADGGPRQAFTPWPFQRDCLIPFIHETEKGITLKVRRFGFTLIALHYFAWLGGYSASGYNSYLSAISHRHKASAKLLTEVRKIFGYIEETAPWLACPIGAQSEDDKGRRGTDQATYFTIAHRGATIEALPPNEGPRGDTITLLFLDEFGRYEGSANPETVWQAAEPAIQGGGRVLIGSSSGGRFGKGELLARLWDGAADWRPGAEAEPGKNGFKRLFIPRSARPEFNRPGFFEERVAALGGSVARAAMEYPSTPEEALQGDLSGMAFDPDGINAAVEYGRVIRDQIERGELTPAGGTVDIGIDWGHTGTGWCIRWDLANWVLYIRKSDTYKEMDAVAKATQIVETAERLCGVPIHEELYDPGGSGAAENKVFARVHGPRIKRRRVGFGQRKAPNVTFLQELFARTARAAKLGAQLGDGSCYGIIAIDPEDCAELLNQLRAAQVGKDGGLEKDDEQHELDALICVVDRKQLLWDKQHRERGAR